MDAEDGNLTARVLSCPPQACLAYGCAGHEYTVKGLQGCGVDTVNAPVDTLFEVPFMVFDHGAPAQVGNATRIVTVVSPCAASEVYCPSLSPRCGSASCAARGALAAPPEADLFADLRLDSSFAHARIGSKAGMLALELFAECQRPASAPLTFCDAAATDCTVYWGGNVTAAPAVELVARLAVPSPGTPGCSAAMLVQGQCLAGTHEFVYQAYNGYRNVSDMASVTVRVGAPVVAWRMALTVTLRLAGAVGASTKAAMLASMQGSTDATNAVLLHASSALLQLLQSCGAADPATGALFGSAHVALEKSDTPSAELTYNVGEDETAAQVCLIVVIPLLQI